VGRGGWGQRAGRGRRAASGPASAEWLPYRVFAIRCNVQPPGPFYPYREPSCPCEIDPRPAMAGRLEYDAALPGPSDPAVARIAANREPGAPRDACRAG